MTFKMFIKDCTSNIPKVNIIMVSEYLKNNDYFNDSGLMTQKLKGSLNIIVFIY